MPKLLCLVTVIIVTSLLFRLQGFELGETVLIVDNSLISKPFMLENKKTGNNFVHQQELEYSINRCTLYLSNRISVLSHPRYKSQYLTATTATDSTPPPLPNRTITTEHKHSMALCNTAPEVFCTNTLNGDDNLIRKQELPPVAQQFKYHHGKRLGKREVAEKLYSGKVGYRYEVPAIPEWQSSSLKPPRHPNCICLAPPPKRSKRVLHGLGATVGDGFDDLLFLDDLTEEVHGEMEEELMDEEVVVVNEEQVDKEEEDRRVGEHV